VSNQTDVIIYDVDLMPPVFQLDDFVVVLASSLVACIEVKSNLSVGGSEYRSATEKLRKTQLMHDKQWESPQPKLLTGVVSFRNEFLPLVKGKRRRTPKRMVSFLRRHYVRQLEDKSRDTFLTDNYGDLPAVVPTLTCSLDTPWLLYSTRVKARRGSPLAFRGVIQVTAKVDDKDKVTRLLPLHLFFTILQHHLLGYVSRMRGSKYPEHMRKRLDNFNLAGDSFSVKQPAYAFAPRWASLKEALPGRAVIPE